jgi:PmbA protein
VNVLIASTETPNEALARLQNLAHDVLARCRAAGADQAEVGVTADRGINVNVRMGEVETLEHTRDRGVAVTVYYGQRKGSANTADLAAGSIAATIAQACAIARYTEPDPCAGLADAARMATQFPDLDLWHPWAVSAEQAIELGARCEAAGRALDARLNNSDGANVASGESLGVYANTHGFLGAERSTRHSVSCALIAEDEHGMQRDYWYDTVRSIGDMAPVEQIGREAGRRTLRRLGARALSTRQCPVLYVPELARGLIGHLVGAVSGGALYRRASFLLDAQGQALFPSWFQLREMPFLQRGHGSAAFDAEGVATVESDLVRDGVLQRYVLGSYSARKLGLQSTGNAGGVHNLIACVGARDFAGMLRELDTGLVVTELMGQGVNTVTGDYSRGAAGYWVERGEVAYPVEEITIAGNLREMYRGLMAVGSDVDVRSHVQTGSWLIERMTVAGASAEA